MRIEEQALTSPRGATRRRFIKQASALLASGLAIGFQLPEALAKAGNANRGPDPQNGEFEPNAWVRVLPDDTIKLVVHKHDSGTGTRTALAAVVAEELDVDPFRIDVITPGESLLCRLHPSAVESVFHGRKHQRVARIRSAAARGRDRSRDADRGRCERVERAALRLLDR